MDILYFLGMIIAIPIWFPRMLQTGKHRTDWAGRFGRTPFHAPKSCPRLLLHAVSVGEVNAIRTFVEKLEALENAPEVVISATTDTGFRRAIDLWGDRHFIVRYPFDVSFAVNRFLQTVEPDAVLLVELEVWPNFVAACGKRGIPVCVINGRLTERSFKKYKMIRGIIRRGFQSLSFAAVQNVSYARRFGSLGVPTDRISITGTMKWDNARITDSVDDADVLAEELGIDRSRPLIVAGSTAPDEHELLVQSKPEGVQLLCAPRKPEWFDHAAACMPGCVRRSLHTVNKSNTSDYFLLDTIGELRQAYALADVVVVGRTFGALYGSDMMEPVALGKATVIGPSVADFQDTADALLAGDGIVQTTRTQLQRVLQELLNHSKRRNALGENGRRVIESQQGATQKSLERVMAMLNESIANSRP